MDKEFPNYEKFNKNINENNPSRAMKIHNLTQLPHSDVFELLTRATERGRQEYPVTYEKNKRTYLVDRKGDDVYVVKEGSVGHSNRG